MPDHLTPAAAAPTAREAAGRYALRVGVPASDGAALALSVSEALTGERRPVASWAREGGVRELTTPGVTARLTGGWDGPTLTLTRWAGSPGPELDGPLLARIAGSRGPSRRVADHGPRDADRGGTATAVPLPETDGGGTRWYRAWRELAELCGLPSRACAEVVAPGVLRATGHRDPVLVYDHAGPPPMPPGWLLQSWSAHQAGLHHFSRRPGKGVPVLDVRSARPEERERAAALRRAWAALVAQAAGERPLPPGAPAPVLPSFADLGPL